MKVITKSENIRLEQVLAIGLPENECCILESSLKRKDAVETLRFGRFSGKNKEDTERIFGEVTDDAAFAEEWKQLETGGLIISPYQKVLSWAAEHGIATIGYQPSENTEFLHADMIVEGFEEIDETFFTHVFERHHNLPWTILETKRCIVRELALSDIDALFELYAGDGMTEFMEDLYPYEEEIKYQKAYIENMYRFYGYGMWLVFEKATGKLIGRAGVEHREELGGEMELGYAIGTPYQRKGYATEVCSAIVDYARNELMVQELTCLIEPENSISIHLAEKLGFSFVEKRKIGKKEMLKYQCSL